VCDLDEWVGVSLTRICGEAGYLCASKMVAIVTLGAAVERVVGERSVPPLVEASYMDVLKVAGQKRC